jgi:hypothetical protein
VPPGLPRLPIAIDRDMRGASWRALAAKGETMASQSPMRGAAITDNTTREQIIQ